MTRRDLEIMLIKKAWADESFKKELLSNTKSAIERLLVCKLPVDMEIIAVEENEDKVYIVLPVEPEDWITV